MKLVVWTTGIDTTIQLVGTNLDSTGFGMTSIEKLHRIHDLDMVILEGCTVLQFPLTLNCSSYTDILEFLYIHFESASIET